MSPLHSKKGRLKYLSTCLHALPASGCAALLVACAAPVAHAQTGASLEREFASPPASARPWVYWFIMDGNFSREGITADLEAMQRAGIGGAIVMEVGIGIPRGPVAFMGPEWRALWKHAVREAERTGIALTLNGGPGWTGSGGPWVKPELSMRTVSSAALEVSGPQKFSGVLPRPANRSRLTDLYEDVRVLAFPKPKGRARIAEANQKSFFERGASIGEPSTPPFIASRSLYPATPEGEAVAPLQVLDITQKLASDGRLSWDVPAGDWVILRFGATNNGYGAFPAPVPGAGLESDKFSKAALEAQFDSFIGTLLKEIGPRKISPDAGWNGLHIDSWEVGPQNWTPGFLEEFRKRRKYDATPFLPAVSGFVVGSREASERFLWDWRQTCQELVVENHVRHFRDLGRRQGFALSAEHYDKVMAADVSLGAPADVPMAEFWTDNSVANYTVAEATSTAHTNGRKIVGAEAFTSGPGERWSAHPASLKAQGDWALTQGINRFVFHRYQHQPELNKFPGMTMGPYGVHWERTQTWWPMVPAYHKYLQRSQHMLRQGLPVSDVCYLVAEGAPQVFRAPASATKGSPLDRLGYSFDACAPENLIANMVVKNGRLTLPDGASYQVLVLPERDTMTPALLRKISQLVAQGATVIGPRPVKSPSLSGGAASDAEVRALAAKLWGKADGVKVTQSRFGKGRVVWKRAPGDDLARAKTSPLAPGQWIWHAADPDPASKAPVGSRTFRRAFSVPDAAAVVEASLTATADNSFVARVNGQEVGSGDDFKKPFAFDIARFLRRGENVVEVEARNGTISQQDQGPNPAGFLAALKIKARGGQESVVATDEQWQSRAAEGEPWAAARVLGELSMGPWGLKGELLPEQYGDFAIASGVLASAGTAPDFESDGPIRYIHRRIGAPNGAPGAGTELYFVANREARALDASCTFRVSGQAPELWSPLTGEVRALPKYLQAGGRTTVPLRFEPHESWFVVFRRPAKPQGRPAPNAAANFFPLTKAAALEGAWQVSFDPKWGGPAQIEFANLEDWSRRAEDGIRHYSGQATYRKSFEAPATRPGEEVWIDLGRVENIASVRLNGRDLGTVWCAPWRVRATGALREGQNSLEVTVANLWPNRLIGDAALPEEKRLTSTTWNPFGAGDSLLPSGLLGPVTLATSRR